MIPKFSSHWLVSESWQRRKCNYTFYRIQDSYSWERYETPFLTGSWVRSEGISNSHRSAVGLELFSLWLWHCWVLNLVWSKETPITQAVHILTCMRVVICCTVPSNFKWRGKQEWKWTFLKLLVSAELPVPFSHDTSNFHLGSLNWFFSPSINLAESYNYNVLTETT